MFKQDQLQDKSLLLFIQHHQMGQRPVQLKQPKLRKLKHQLVSLNEKKCSLHFFLVCCTKHSLLFAGKLDEIEEGQHPYQEKEPLLPHPNNTNPITGEVGGPKGPEPTRYGDWERKGRVSDF